MNKLELSSKQLAFFCDQLHLILSSSIGLADGISSVIEGFDSEAVRGRLKEVRDNLELNKSLSSSLRLSGLFPDYMLTMVEVGEETGKTDQVMESLGKYYKKQDKLKKQIRDAVTYPLIISFMVMIVIAVLVVKVLPIFALVFSNLGAGVPASLALVTKVSRMITGLVGFAFAFMLLSTIFLYLRQKNAEGRQKNTSLFLSLPGIKSIYKDLQAARFANSLSLLVSSGYDLYRSLELTGKALEEREIDKKIKRAINRLEHGDSLGDVLSETNIFKGLHSQMLRLAVQTGHLDSVLADLSLEYTDDVERSVDKLIGIIEPTLVGATAFIIGGILLTVMLPLLGIMSSMG